jgi:hypothetical protein
VTGGLILGGKITVGLLSLTAVATPVGWGLVGLGAILLFIAILAKSKGGEEEKNNDPTRGATNKSSNSASPFNNKFQKTLQPNGKVEEWSVSQKITAFELTVKVCVPQEHLNKALKAVKELTKSNSEECIKKLKFIMRLAGNGAEQICDAAVENLGIDRSKLMSNVSPDVTQELLFQEKSPPPTTNNSKGEWSLSQRREAFKMTVEACVPKKHHYTALKAANELTKSNREECIKKLKFIMQLANRGDVEQIREAALENFEIDLSKQ